MKQDPPRVPLPPGRQESAEIPPKIKDNFPFSSSMEGATNDPFSPQGDPFGKPPNPPASVTEVSDNERMLPTLPGGAAPEYGGAFNDVPQDFRGAGGLAQQRPPLSSEPFLPMSANLTANSGQLGATGSNVPDFANAGFNAGSLHSPSSDLAFGGPGPPGAQGDTTSLAVPRPKHSHDEQIERALEIASPNPIVAAAAPLLWLITRLNECAPPEDLGGFRARVLEEIQAFDTAAVARGVSPQAARVAQYLICATIDDVLLNTTLRGHTNWAGAGLVSSLYSETIGGERFFDLLSRLYAAPEANVELLELGAICLSIGFVGKYRVIPGGQGQLNRVRSEIYRTLRQVRGPYDRTLAPPWEIVPEPHRAPPRTMPFWVIAGAAASFLLILYLALSILIHSRLEAAKQQLSALVPSVPVLVDKPPIPAIPVPAVPPPPRVEKPPPQRPAPLTQVERISARLKSDIAAGKVQVIGSPKTITVRLPNFSFRSAQAALSSSEEPLIKRIAAALDKEPGTIQVVGYTDNIPVGSNSAFPNNKALSQARAESVAEAFKKSLSNPGRVVAEGRGDADPIASNKTPEGRAQNRRVEFVIPAEKAP